MAESNELKKIKKMYGENFMKLCRSLFPTLLETEGRLSEILSLCFSENCKTLYDDIINNQLEEEFKTYIYSKIDVEDQEKKIIGNKTPFELLEEAGYDLIECTTEEDIQAFKKYYATKEELCTFNGGRLDRCVVFFAVRKDVENIKREDFQRPKREDEYGTSVLGIQFEKQGMCTVSIKNRYNHTVNNPDATYGNDLDKITYGLTQSFGELLKQRGLELSSSNIEKLEIPGYVVASDGKYYKYNMEINGRYYCPGNVIIENGQAHKLENPERQVLIDYFILDMEKKTLKVYDPILEDSFTDIFEQLEKIEIRKDKEKGNGRRTITIQKKGQEEPIIIEIDKTNQIVGYRNQGLTQIGNEFLLCNKVLAELELPSLAKVGDDFLYSNQGLTELKLPSLAQVGNNFLYRNQGLTELKLPTLVQVKNNFLWCNQGLTELKLPSLEQVGDNLLHDNEGLIELYVPKLPELRKKFSDIIEKNQKKQETEAHAILDAKSIADLDKASELTTSEIHQAGEILKNPVENEKNERSD